MLHGGLGEWGPKKAKRQPNDSRTHALKSKNVSGEEISGLERLQERGKKNKQTTINEEKEGEGAGKREAKSRGGSTCEILRGHGRWMSAQMA